MMVMRKERYGWWHDQACFIELWIAVFIGIRA